MSFWSPPASSDSAATGIEWMARDRRRDCSPRPSTWTARPRLTRPCEVIGKDAAEAGLIVFRVRAGYPDCVRDTRNLGRPAVERRLLDHVVTAPSDAIPRLGEADLLVEARVAIGSTNSTAPVAPSSTPLL